MSNSGRLRKREWDLEKDASQTLESEADGPAIKVARQKKKSRFGPAVVSTSYGQD